MNKQLNQIGYLLLFFANLLCYPVAAEETKTAPKLDIELFTKLQYTRQVEISPDGKHIAIIFKRNGEDMLGIVRLSDMQAVKVMQAYGKTRQIGRAIWVSNERLVYNILKHSAWDKELYYSSDLYAVNIDGKKHRAVMGTSAKRSIARDIGKFGHHDIIDILPEEERYILVAFYPWKEGVRYYYRNETAKPIVYKLNIYNGNLKQVAKLPVPLSKGFSDNNHQVRLSYGFDIDATPIVYHRKDNDSEWHKLTLKGLPNAIKFTPARFSNDNNKLYMWVEEESGPNALYLYDLDKHQAEKIYRHQEGNINKLVFNQQDKVVALAVEVGYPQYFMIDGNDALSQIYKKLLKQMQGFNIDVSSQSADGKKMIVNVYSDYQPSIYFVYDSETKQLNKLLSSRQWIKGALMASQEPVKFKARDGLTLHGYLTRPLGKTQSLPTVILPHGGPHGVRDYWGFNWEAQLLANRGYAVLQLNFRGSDGYGLAFEQAGYGRWGAEMQNDLTDATLQLIEQGIADKNRICIYGASYGGYAALMGAIREPDLYQCAIGSVGVYSLPMMFQEGDISDSKIGLNYLKQILSKDPVKLKTNSPAYNTDKIKAPLLLIHGAKDKRAPIEHLEALEKGLKANNKSYEKLIIGNEGHGYYDENNRVKVYSKIIQFLDKHIGAK